MAAPAIAKNTETAVLRILIAPFCTFPYPKTPGQGSCFHGRELAVGVARAARVTRVAAAGRRGRRRGRAEAGAAGTELRAPVTMAALELLAHLLLLRLERRVLCPHERALRGLDDADVVAFLEVVERRLLVVAEDARAAADVDRRRAVGGLVGSLGQRQLAAVA